MYIIHQFGSVNSSVFFLNKTITKPNTIGFQKSKTKPNQTQIKSVLFYRFGLVFRFGSVFIQTVNTPIYGANRWMNDNFVIFSKV